MLRHIPLGKMHNLRDLGGYPAAGGHMTAWERLLRGDNPQGLTEEDLQWLLRREITTVIDLRSAAELEQTPDQLSTVPEFAYFHCPLLSGDQMPNLEEDVGRGYFHALDRMDSVREALRLVAQAPGGVLFHCTAGKDRTGMLAALLLGLAGVSREDILADYQVSEVYLAQIIQQIKVFVPDLAPFAGQSKSEYMSGCLDLLEERYGSIPGYLESAGMTAEELDALRNKTLA